LLALGYKEEVMTWDYPAFMTSVQHYWLDGDLTSGEPATGGGLVKAIADAIAAAPFAALTGYDPATDVGEMVTAVGVFNSLVTGMSPAADFVTFHSAAAAEIDSVISPDSYITARASAHATALDSEVTTKVIPRFESGMRDINAVLTSAFVIGRAIIEMDRNDKVDKFMADMRYQADAKRGDLIASATGEIIRLSLQKLEYYRVVAAITLDQKRIAIAAQNDYKTEIKALASDKGKWALECYKYGANMLTSIGGTGTTSSIPMDGNKTARILATGLSGAVAGATVGNMISPGGEGAGYGAIVGGLAGLLGGS
jgi:hypothetical protein